MADEIGAFIAGLWPPARWRRLPKATVREDSSIAVHVGRDSEAYCAACSFTASKSRRFYEAHRSHAYQHAARRYGAHLPVTLAVGVINLLWLLPLAYVAVLFPELGLALLAVAWLPLILVALSFRAGASRYVAAQ